MSAMGNFIIEVAELVHVGNTEAIEKKLEPLDKDQKIAVLLHAIEGNFEALSLCACNWCETARNKPQYSRIESMLSNAEDGW
jgi:hypothetical protein